MITPTYPCADVPETAEWHYGRLCRNDAGDWPEFNSEDLNRLAELMRDSPEKRTLRGKEPERFVTMPSGYVYLGQFIDHDITRDTRTLDRAAPDVENTLNYRTPALDLDLLYGKNPADVPCIYEDDGLRLRLGPTEESPTARRTIASTFDDLPRDNGTAVVIDPRSDENLIIAQLHVLFAKFHNAAVDLLTSQPDIFPTLAGEDLFEQVRRFVTWHYQWIVIHDFLPTICRVAVLNDIAANKFRLFPRRYTTADYPVALPVEFTVAAFRFGHSVVQSQYILNSEVAGNSSEIIRMTKRGTGIHDRLPAKYVLDWDNFFTGTEMQLNRSQPIDTFISEALYDLPRPAAYAFRFQVELMPAHFGFQDRMSPPLPEVTLQRGSRMRLPSGQEFASRFGYNSISPDIIPAPPDEEFFPIALRTRTPLWYYLLREAATEPNPEPPLPHLGLPLQKLGSIGSQIVAETLYQLLYADPHSFANAVSAWEPPTFNYGTSGPRWSFRSMLDVVSFVRRRN